MLKSYCYSSRQLRKAIQKGQIIAPEITEEQIQPSSFEPTLSKDLYIVDSEYSGVFRNPKQETVYKSLCRLSKRQRPKISIENGFELKKGFSYLLPLNEKVKLPKDTYIKNSPKSSLGRLFINSRLIADYNPSFNEINSSYCCDEEISLWLYVQPLAFNIIVYPGLSLNQLRFFKGYNAQLSPKELIKALERNPLLYTLDSEGKKIPASPIVSDGLTIHLNLSGKRTQNVIGLRARHNPVPVDLSKKKEFAIDDYFEPLTRKDRVIIKSGEYYLLSSREVVKVPKHLNIELRDYSHVGFSGPLHFAGFIDNGFEGDLVYEIRSDELSKGLELTHNMPISKLDVYRTAKPDKIYSQETNNYKFQIGPKPAKYFKDIDFKYLAQRYTQLDQDVLVVDQNIIRDKLNGQKGFIELDKDEYENLFQEIKDRFYQSRYNCEADDLVTQIVVYLVIKKDQKFLTYEKADNLERYGEDRLFNKQSLGIGAHLTKRDFPDPIPKAIKRSLRNKKVKVKNPESEPKFVGAIFSTQNYVDKFHLGLIYFIDVDDVEISEESIAKNWEFVTKSKLAKLRKQKDYESWSDIIIENIRKFT